VPAWRCQPHRGQNDLPEDGKILHRLQDRLLKIESQTRVYGTSWKVLQSNLDQLEDKLNAIFQSLPTKSSESKVRFAGWSTSRRGSSSQSEGLSSEGSSPSASRTTHKGHVWQKGKSWRNIPQPHKEETESKDSKKVDTRPYWVSGGPDYRFRLARHSRPESGWINPRDRQVPVLEGRDVSSPGSSSGSIIPTELPVLVCSACRSMGKSKSSRSMGKRSKPPGQDP